MSSTESSNRSSDALRQALGHHHAGRLAQAEQIYRTVLAREPEHAEALHLLATVTF
ncbi:MAG: hypothetical protein VCD33_07875 [Alphaproteobacteria bacterium]